MTSANVNFMETLNKILTQKERDLLRELSNQQVERTEIQRLLEMYDTFVWDEQKHQRQFVKVLEDAVKCKNDDDLDIFESKAKDMMNDIKYFKINSTRLSGKFSVNLGIFESYMTRLFEKFSMNLDEVVG